MAFDHEPRNYPQPADFEYGKRSLEKGSPLSTHVLDILTERRLAVAALTLQSDLDTATARVQDAQQWGPLTEPTAAIELHQLADEIALRVTPPAEAGNAD